MGLGISVGEKGRAGEGRALLHGHPRTRAEKLFHADGYALMRGLPSVLAARAEADPYAPYRRFAVQWTTALGSTDAAVRDTGRARPFTQAGTLGGLFVMDTASEGRDYPTARFLQSRTRTTNPLADGQQLKFFPSSGYIPLCAIGEGIVARWWYRYVASLVTDPNLTNHPSYFHDATGASSSTTTGLSVEYGRGFPLGSGEDAFQISLRTPNVNTQLNSWNEKVAGSVRRYARNTTYRVETLYQRTAADDGLARIVIYDVSGNVVSSESSWFAWHGGMASTNLVGTTFGSTPAGNAQAEQMRGFTLGSEAADDAGAIGRLLHEWAGPVIYQGPIASLPWPVGGLLPGELTL